MEAIYRLKSSELNEKFIRLIRTLYKDKEIEITISANPAGRGKKEFLEAIDDVRLRKNLISFSVEEFKDFSEKLIAK